MTVVEGILCTRPLMSYSRGSARPLTLRRLRSWSIQRVQRIFGHCQVLRMHQALNYQELVWVRCVVRNADHRKFETSHTTGNEGLGIRPNSNCRPVRAEHLGLPLFKIGSRKRALPRIPGRAALKRMAVSDMPFVSLRQLRYGDAGRYKDDVGPTAGERTHELLIDKLSVDDGWNSLPSSSMCAVGDLWQRGRGGLNLLCSAFSLAGPPLRGVWGGGLCILWGRRWGGLCFGARHFRRIP